MALAWLTPPDAVTQTNCVLLLMYGERSHQMAAAPPAPIPFMRLAAVENRGYMVPSPEAEYCVPPVTSTVDNSHSLSGLVIKLLLCLPAEAILFTVLMPALSCNTAGN